tara:strand:- start:178 stop:1434 length:1257 start_codon:yes stop_codon:yes gene_type:complete
MSNLLDQAIIDAEALKEVAKKNAEATILEKFSDQIKEAVEQILDEQPEDEGAEEMEAAELEGGDVLDQLEPASAEGVEMCACPDIKDNVSVTVDLPSLEAELDGMPSPEESEKVADADMADAAEDDLELPSLEDSLEEEFEIDESSLQEFVFESAEPSTELNLEEELLEELMGMLEEDAPAADDAVMGAFDEKAEAEERAASTPQDAPYELEESVDTEEEVVEEALTVDIDPLNSLQSGHGPAPNAVFELAEEQLLAMLQDSENKEKHEAMQKALKDLQESNGRLATDLEKLSSDKKELIKIVSKVKNRLEESNLTNARLLYTNKVLMSDSLNERQRNKIVEALSNSESVEEAKVIYETLQSATGSTIENKKPESLSEAMNKTTSTLILSHRKRDREKTTQDDSSLTRWKILAGLNNK